MQKFIPLLICFIIACSSCSKESTYKKETLLGRWYLTYYNAAGHPEYTMIQNLDTTTSYLFYPDNKVVIKKDSLGIQVVEDGQWEVRVDSILTIKTGLYTNVLIINSLLLGTLKVTDTNIPDTAERHIRIYERRD
jgi:hypothetical protein